MRFRLNFVLAVGAASAVLWLAVVPTAGQSAAQLFPTYRATARAADGKPDLNGIWQSFTTANWDILAHAAQPGPHPDIMGAWGAVPGGQGIVEGNEIPYQPWAAAKQKENYEKRMVVKVTNDPHRYDTGEPELQCYRPGVPRANYMPFPFQIFQTPEQILIVYRVQGRDADDLHEQQERSAERHLDGMVERAMGRRYPGRGHDGLQREHLVRPRGKLPQRRAARRGALHAGQARSTSSTKRRSRTRRSSRGRGG